MGATKICFKCKKEKLINDFYKHPQMADGHVNKCKECNKRDVEINYENNVKNPEWVEKERFRGREKYKRLNYIEKYKYSEIKFSFRKGVKFKNVHKYLKLDKYIEAHHWNYNVGFEYDIIKLTRSQHKIVHKYMFLDYELLLYRTKELKILDTKENHINFINTILYGNQNSLEKSF
jgi:hypothetical protein